GDSAGAVHEQVREPGRQHVRLFGVPVVHRGEVDRLLVDVPDHLHSQRRHPALGVVADQTVGNEGVVVGMNAKAEYGLDTGVLATRDLGVGEAAIHQWLDDFERLVAQPVGDLRPEQFPAAYPVDVSRNATGRHRQAGKYSAKLLVLRAKEADPAGEQLRISPTGDHNRDLTVGVPALAGHDALLEQ